MGTYRNVSLSMIVLVICGLVGILVGLWVQWRIPLGAVTGEHGSVGFPPGTEFGLRGPDFTILLVAVGGALVALLVARYWRQRGSGLALLVTGSVVAVLAARWIEVLTGSDGVAFEYFLLGPGAYLTLGGAVFLFVAGSFHLDTTRPVHTTGTEREPGADDHNPAGQDPESTPQSGRMKAPSWSRRDRLVAVPVSVQVLVYSGLVALVAGVWLAWIVVHPGANGATSTIEVSAGLSVGDVALLAVAFCAVGAGFALSNTGRPHIGGYGFLLAGLLALAVPVWRYLVVMRRNMGTLAEYLDSPPLFVTKPIEGPAFFGPGLFVTLCGGGLLVIAGVLHWHVTGADSQATTEDQYQGPANMRQVSTAPWGTVALSVVALVVIVLCRDVGWYAPLPGTGSATVPSTGLGLAGPDTVLLGMIVVGVLVSLACLLRPDWWRRAAGFLVVTGMLSSSLTMWRLFEATGGDGVALEAFVIGPGGYLTLGGFLLLLVAGALIAGVEEGRRVGERDGEQAASTVSTPMESS